MRLLPAFRPLVRACLQHGCRGPPLPAPALPAPRCPAAHRLASAPAAVPPLPMAGAGQAGGLLGLLGLAPEDGTLPQRLEPKTFLASERTFLSWVRAVSEQQRACSTPALLGLGSAPGRAGWAGRPACSWRASVPRRACPRPAELHPAPRLPATPQMHMAVTLAAIGSALLAFAANTKKSKDHMHAVRAAARPRERRDAPALRASRRVHRPQAVLRSASSLGPHPLLPPPFVSPSCSPARSAPTWWRPTRCFCTEPG